MNLYALLHLSNKYESKGIYLDPKSLIRENGKYKVNTTSYAMVYLTFKDLANEHIGMTKDGDTYIFTKTYENGSNINFKAPRSLFTWLFDINGKVAGMLVDKHKFPFEIEDCNYVEDEDNLFIKDKAKEMDDVALLKELVESTPAYRRLKEYVEKFQQDENNSEPSDIEDEDLDLEY